MMIFIISKFYTYILIYLLIYLEKLLNYLSLIYIFNLKNKLDSLKQIYSILNLKNYIIIIIYKKYFLKYFKRYNFIGKYYFYNIS